MAAHISGDSQSPACAVDQGMGGVPVKVRRRTDHGGVVRPVAIAVSPLWDAFRPDPAEVTRPRSPVGVLSRRPWVRSKRDPRPVGCVDVYPASKAVTSSIKRISLLHAEPKVPGLNVYPAIKTGNWLSPYVSCCHNPRTHPHFTQIKRKLLSRT